MEFLSVSGALATLIGVAVLVPIITGHVSANVIQHPIFRTSCAAVTSFSYALLLARFDLQKANNLRLTIVFSLLMRFICIPVLSHIVAIAGYALGRMSTAKTAAAVAAAKAPATAKATAASLSLPAAVLSSLFLLSTTPVGYSPSAAMLSRHIHTTLMAILTTLTLLFFPLLPCISHRVSLWAHSSALLNIGAILPKVAPPPSVPLLLVTTTIPVMLGLMTNRLLPRRWAAIGGFVALPIAWTCSLLLLASAVGSVVSGSMTGLVGSVGLCAGVGAMMVLLGRALACALLLDYRAERTLMLYLCTQGAVVGVGVAPVGFASAPLVASALVGLIFTIVMGRLWSHVIIRTSRDVIL